jgi:predicted nucleic acid-binding protein
MGIVIDTNILIYLSGIRREIRDLLIAAIALQNGCKLLTNASHK